MSQSKPSFKRNWDREAGEDFFDWRDRMSSENLALLQGEVHARGADAVHPRSDLAIRWPALESFVRDTQDKSAGRVLRPLVTPRDDLALPQELDGLHVWVVSVPEAALGE